MRKISHFILKLIITSGLMYLIYKKMDINTFILYFNQISTSLIIFISLIPLLKKSIESYRWFFILKSLKQNVKLKSLFAIYMIGGFFNIILPSTIGGDTLRVLYIKNKNFSTLEAANSVLLERITGVYAMLLITFIATIFGWNFFNYEYKFIILIASGFGLVTLTLLHFNYHIFVSIAKKIKTYFNYKFLDKVYILIKSLDFSHYKNSVLLNSIAMSILIQLTFYSITILIGNSLGLNQLKIYHYLILLPPILFISILPISIGGFGVREGLYGLFFMPLGISLEQSTLLSMLSFLPYLMLAIFGSVFYIAKQKPSSVIERL